MCSSGSSQLLPYLQGHQVQSTRKDIEDSLPSRGVLQDPQHPHTLSYSLVHLKHSRSSGASHNHTARTSAPTEPSRSGSLPAASQQTLQAPAAHTGMSDSIESGPRSSASSCPPAGPSERPCQTMFMRSFANRGGCQGSYSQTHLQQSVALVCHPFSH